jgi:hypothetical protein
MYFVSKILWSKLFIEAQGLSIETIPVLCDWKRMVKQALESVHVTSISSSSTLPT